MFCSTACSAGPAGDQQGQPAGPTNRSNATVNLLESNIGDGAKTKETTMFLSCHGPPDGDFGFVWIVRFSNLLE